MMMRGWKKVKSAKYLLIHSKYDKQNAVQQLIAMPQVVVALTAEISSEHNDDFLEYHDTDSRRVWKTYFETDDVASRLIKFKDHATLYHDSNSCSFPRTHQLRITSQWTPKSDGAAVSSESPGVFSFDCSRR